LSLVDELSRNPHNLLRGLTEIWDPTSQSMELLAMLHTDTVSEDHPGRHRTVRLRRVHEHILEECFADLDRFAPLSLDS